MTAGKGDCEVGKGRSADRKRRERWTVSVQSKVRIENRRCPSLGEGCLLGEGPMSGRCFGRKRILTCRSDHPIARKIGQCGCHVTKKTDERTFQAPLLGGSREGWSRCEKGNAIAMSRTEIDAIGGTWANSSVRSYFPRLRRFPGAGKRPGRGEGNLQTQESGRVAHQGRWRPEFPLDRGKLSRHQSRSIYFARLLLPLRGERQPRDQ